MALPPGKTSASGRRPSLRGILIQDVVFGTERTRKWPRKKPKRPTPAEKRTRDQFRTMQRATKYFAPRMYLDFMNMVEGTPLLPRDVMTMMLANRLFAFVTEQGKVLWPMPARIDVSEALDTINNEPGKSLIRGEQGWEEYIPGQGGGYRLIDDFTVTLPIAEYVSPDLADYPIVIIWGNLLASDSDVQRLVQGSTDGGQTWLDQGGNYARLNTSGTATNQNGIYPQGIFTELPVSFIVVMMNVNAPDAAPYFEFPRALSGWVNKGAAPLTNLRIVPGTSSGPEGNLTAGNIKLFGIL